VIEKLLRTSIVASTSCEYYLNMQTTLVLSPLSHASGATLSGLTMSALAFLMVMSHVSSYLILTTESQKWFVKVT